MTEEILVNVTPRETRVAVVENGMLQELHIERGWRRGVVGNIYKGRVQRIMPGMQAAFVDIGLERAAFLHAGDIVKPAPVTDHITRSGIAIIPDTLWRSVSRANRPRCQRMLSDERQREGRGNHSQMPVRHR